MLTRRLTVLIIACSTAILGGCSINDLTGVRRVCPWVTVDSAQLVTPAGDTVTAVYKERRCD